MLKLLVVDRWDDRRAAMVDALCELPGVEVRATATDTAGALALIDHLAFDAVVAINNISDASIDVLIDGALQRGVANIIADTMADLIARASALAANRTDQRERRRVLARQLESTVLIEPRAAVLTQATMSGGATIIRMPQTARAPQLISVGQVLRDAMPRLSRVVHEEIQLVLEVVAGVPRVRCAIDDIERIALHLVLDAADAIPLGGKVWLFVEREGHRHVRIEALDSGGLSRPESVGADTIRAITNRYGGDLRIVALPGGATSLQVILPATVEAPS